MNSRRRHEVRYGNEDRITEGFIREHSHDTTMKRAARASSIRTVRITGGDYPVASIVRLRVEQALYGRGERIWPPARRLRWRSRKKCDLFLLAVGAPPLQVLSTVYWIFTLWSGREDLNLRHPAPKAGALPGCATPRRLVTYAFLVRQHRNSTNPFIQECFDRCPGNA